MHQESNGDPCDQSKPLELAPSLFEVLLDAHESKPMTPSVHGLVIGCVESLESDGLVRVTSPVLGNTPVLARTLCVLCPADTGRQCALMFEQGDPARAVIMGLLQHPVLAVTSAGETQAEIGKDKFRMEAEREILLTCGKASLRLTQDGRIELRGTTLISHASAVNRIRGGAVKLN